MSSRALAVVLMVGLLVTLDDAVAGAIPDSVDWRTKGVVTAVKNQGETTCNFSWAFAATGALEGAHALQTGSLASLSEQELIDCGGSCGDPEALIQCACPQLGCSFELVDAAGLCSEAAYPYVARVGTCKTGCAPVVDSGTTNWTRIGPGDEAAMRTALAVGGPIIARLEVGAHGAPLPAYLAYSGGLFGPVASDATVVQWVLVVGYTPGYFIVKNSLGTSWGASGYMQLARGANVLGVENNAYAVTEGGGAGPIPDAPCTQAAAVPALSPLATLGLALGLCLLGLALLRRYAA